MWIKCYQIALHGPEKSLMGGRVNWCNKFCCCLIWRNCHSHPSLSHHHPDWSAAFNIGARFSTENRPWIAEGSYDDEHFLLIKYFLHCFFLRYNTIISHLTDYSIVYTLGNEKFMWLTLLWGLELNLKYFQHVPVLINNTLLTPPHLKASK